MLQKTEATSRRLRTPIPQFLDLLRACCQPSGSSHIATGSRRFTRRSFLLVSGLMASGVAAPKSGQVSAEDKRQDRKGMTLGFGTYGMRSLTTEKAINALSEIGFDSVELEVGETCDAAPEQMPANRRRRVAAQLAASRLQLTSMMEHLIPSKDKPAQEKTLKRLRDAAELGHNLSPDDAPLIQTTLGGRDWESLKGLFRDRLGKWADVGRQMKTVIAIKPHRGGALSRPEQAAWIIGQLGNTPWLRMVYDYSHYAYREMPFSQTIQTALPITAHIAVKDTVQLGDSKTTFVLPGQAGTIDYDSLLKQFYAGGYRGDISCEVSGAVWKKPGYDPIEAAKICYGNLAPLFQRAGVPRRSSYK